MRKIFGLAIISVFILFWGGLARAQMDVKNEVRLLTVTDRLSTIDDSVSLLVYGTGGVSAGGRSFLGIVKAYEMNASANTIVGLAITRRSHGYYGQSKALIAIGGPKKDAPDGVHGVGPIGDNCRVGLVVGDIVALEDNARVGIVIGDIGHIAPKAHVFIKISRRPGRVHSDRIFFNLNPKTPQILLQQLTKSFRFWLKPQKSSDYYNQLHGYGYHFTF